MYTLPHFVWLAVCAVFITVATVLLRKYNPPLKRLCLGRVWLLL